MDVAAWLREHGLEQYIRTFADNDIDGQTLMLLTESDLSAMGITSVGHRRKLARAIERLREQPAASPASPAPPTSASPAPQQAAGAAVPVDTDAEHRQLSVLYCDMVGSTLLSQQLDPEEYREVIRSFHGACVRTVAEYDGWIANFIGDCVLAYFGWPRAHEDDPERAVRTGLALVGAVAHGGVQVRVGIATGSVVVGDLIREGPAKEQSAVGLTPNMGSRLQSLAAPGQVVIDDLTRRLAPAFTVQRLRAQPLKGIAGPVAAFVVTGEHVADSRFDAHKGHLLLAMVGRDQELALLLERWAQARGGEGAGVLLVGEAGIGKSRLTRALLDACAVQACTVRWQCSPYHTGSALWPVVQQLHRRVALHADDSHDAALDKIEATVGEREVSALYATLLGLNGAQRYGPLQMSPQMLRERTLEVLVEQLFEMAEQQPLLLVVEDAHWIDPSTMELIERCLERIEQVPMMILVTSRLDNQPVLAAHPSMTRLSLNRLGHASVENIVAQLAGNSLKPQTRAMIVAQTDGVPLFVEELTKAVVETGETSIPASLHSSLMARLDHLPEVKEVAQAAACVGREFDLALLQAVCEPPDAVAPALAKLVDAELVFQRGDRSRPRYTFKHALVQEAAQRSLLHKRREALHARILHVLESQRPDTPKEVLAQHAAAAGLAEQAIAHWHEAGKAAQAKSAYVEAAALLERAIEAIHAQTDGVDRRVAELDLLLRLGQCRMGIDGLGSESSREVFHRANELLKAGVDSRPSRLPVQYGLWNWYYVHAELSQALQLALEALSAEQADGSREALLIAQRMVATTYGYLGDLAKAQALYDQVMLLVDSERGPDTSSQFLADQRIAPLYQYSLMCGLRGLAGQSRALMERAAKLCVPATPALQRAYLGLLATIRAALERDHAGVRTELSGLVDVATRHRMLPWFEGFIDVLSILEAVDGGQPSEQEIARGLGGIRQLEASGQRLFLPYFTAQLALGLAHQRRHREARLMWERAWAHCAETSQGWCAAELWRVRAELWLRAEAPDPQQAIGCFEQALALGREQGARLWELRAALGLASLLRQQARPDDAVNVLAPVYESWPEDVDTADRVATRGLLRELGYVKSSPAAGA